MFSLLACGAGVSLNFNQMSNKAGLVEKKLSLIYGVSCKQESTLGSPSLPAYVCLLHCSGRTSPCLSPVKTLSVSPFSFLLKCCNLGVVVPYLSAFFVSLFCLSKSKGNSVLKMSLFSRASDRIGSQTLWYKHKDTDQMSVFKRHWGRNWNLISEPLPWIVRKLLPCIKYSTFIFL